MKKLALVFLIFFAVAALLGASVSFGALTFTANNVTGDAALTIDNSGALTIGGTNATTIAIGRSGVSTTFSGGIIIGNLVDASGNKYVTSTSASFVVGTAGQISSTVSGATTTLTLASSGVTAGACTYCSATFDAYGRATAQSSGSAPPTAASPTTAKVGVSTVNGSAATFMRSDAAPPLDTSANFAFTGIETFSSNVSSSGNTYIASATIPTLFDASGNKYVTSTSGISGNGTSTFLAVYNTTTTLSGYSTLAYTSSTDLLSIGTSTIANLNVTTRLQIPTSTALTVAGQVVVRTATSTLEYYDGTNILALNPTSTLQWIIENPTSTEDDAFWIADMNGKITRIAAVNKSTGDTVTFNVVWNASRSNASSTSKAAFTSNQAVTATTTASILTINGSTTFAAGDVFRFVTSAASSSQFTMTVSYQALP